MENKCVWIFVGKFKQISDHQLRMYTTMENSVRETATTTIIINNNPAVCFENMVIRVKISY